MLTPKEILELLTKENLNYTLYRHKAVFSAADEANMPKMNGTVVKNLMLTNKQQELFLFTLPLHAKSNLKALAKKIGSSRLNFAGADDLAVIGTPAGMVSPLSLLNDEGRQVSFLVASELDSSAVINCHPLLNTMSIDITRTDLESLIIKNGHKINKISGVLLEN